MEISEKGIKFLKDLEGFRESPYQCSAKAWTIGYGSTYYLDGTKVRKTDPIISEHDADLLIRHTLGNYQDAINPLLIVTMALHLLRRPRTTTLSFAVCASHTVLFLKILTSQRDSSSLP